MAAAAMLAVPAAADPLVGTWRTPPDGKGIVADIEVAACGSAAVCGVIARTYDSEDHPVHTPNLGVRVFWDMVPAGADRWQGWAFVPRYKKKLRGEIIMQDRRRITVGGCLGPVCQSQDWSRIW